MKLIFENWRKHISEATVNEKSFTFSEAELRKLNKSIAKIVSTAQKVLGGDGPIPYISPKDLERQTREPMRQVAEGEDSDLASLRQKYYGPEGELAKYGPRAVKDLPKGLGKMTASEFEEADLVLKVPEEVLGDFRTLIEGLKKTGELYIQARNWYHNIRKLLDEETKDDRDAALLGMLIATYSPRAKFALNLAEAVFMFKAVQQDANQNPKMLAAYLETFPGAEKFEPGAKRGFTKAHKVPNFALNLIAPELSGHRQPESGKVAYDEVYMWNSTIDTWMIDAFYPLIRKASTAKEWETLKGKLMSNVVSYRYMTNLVAQEAKKLSLLPHELQAIIWVSMQIRQTGETELGVTTEFAFNQIKEAIININSIEQDMSTTLKELENNSWLGMIIDAINKKGFSKASEFVLGTKDEEGKQIAPGVRSITSRGKKGTSFKYFPEPDVEKKPKKKKPASTKPKPVKKYTDPAFKGLNTFYVMNNVIQMPTGKFNNLYDSVYLYLDPKFSSEKAVEYITGRFDPESESSKKYFK